MKPTVLVVDDFENTRFIIEFTLKRYGYEVLKAANGKEALVLLDGRAIDLIITDYNMPQMNGMELTKEVRKMEKYLHTPIYMLTTEQEASLKATGTKEGVTLWIIKPFEMDAFVKSVQKAIRT